MAGVVVPYAAWLRVYEPLAAFPEPERSRWAAYVADPARPGRVELLAAEQAGAVRRAMAVPPRIGPGIAGKDRHHEGAFVLDRSADSTDPTDPTDPTAASAADRTYLCPLDEQLRSWNALAALQQDVPEPLLSAFVPPSVAEQAREAYDQWRRQNPPREPRILTSTWHVPLWWFVAFTAEERLLTLGPTVERTLLYRTGMGKARQRMARALEVLRRTMGAEAMVTEGVEEVARWLEEFHPHSRVELDYGGLAFLVDDDALAADVSAADVADGLAALSAGEPDTAAAAYARLVDRWREVHALEHAT